MTMPRTVIAVIKEHAETTAAKRQRKYRSRRQQRQEEEKQTIMEHHRFRAGVMVALERRRMNVDQLSSLTGIASHIIENGDDGDYGLFRIEEIEAIGRIFPHVSHPALPYRKSLEA